MSQVRTLPFLSLNLSHKGLSIGRASLAPTCSRRAQAHPCSVPRQRDADLLLASSSRLARSPGHACGRKDLSAAKGPSRNITLAAAAASAPAAESLPATAPAEESSFAPKSWLEDAVESTVLASRFFALLAVVGSLVGSLVCFVRGCKHVSLCLHHIVHHFQSDSRGLEVMHLISALDVYLMGTILLIIAGGLFEIFIGPLWPRSSTQGKGNSVQSALVGLFPLRSQPKWLGVTSLDELKTKLGHVIVMILLVGMFERSKRVQITSPTELLVYASAFTVSSVGLWVLTKLSPEESGNGSASSAE